MLPAIILAAGASSRMGRPKALLPLPNGRCFLTQIEASLRAAGLTEIVAVLGYGAAAIRDAIQRVDQEASPGAARRSGSSPLHLVDNPDPSRGQLSSLLVGLDAVSALMGGEPDAVLVTIVDLPLVSSDTIARVVAAWRATRAPVVRPVWGGRHGHPVVFDRRLLGELREADPAVGARGIVHAHAASVVDVSLEDAGAFDDIDTPGDYRRVFGQAPR